MLCGLVLCWTTGQASNCFAQQIEQAHERQNKETLLHGLRHRAEIYQYQGNYPLAWLDLAYGELLAPEDVRFKEGLGWLAIFRGRYLQAVTYLQTAEALAPQNPWVQLNLGWAYYLSGQEKKALRLWAPFLTDKNSKYYRALQKDKQRLNIQRLKIF